MLNILIILITLIIIILFCLCMSNSNTTEPYQNLPEYKNNQIWNPKWVSNYRLYDGNPIQDSKVSSDCYSLNSNQCLKTPNCGLCHNEDNNKIECVPGDDDGPLFKANCKKWIYANYFDRYIYGNKEIYVVDPWSKIYDEQKPGLPTPWARSTV